MLKSTSALLPNMARSQSNYWGQHDLSRMCLGLSADMDPNLPELQQQQIAKECDGNMSIPQSPFYHEAFRLTPDSRLRPYEGDQVVPSSHRRAAFGGRQKEAKPLPPLPDPEELMSDEAADSEVEFFTSDRRRLLPKSCPKAVCRGGSRDHGQVNHAYQEGSLRSMAFSWPGREDRWTLPPAREDHQQILEAACSKQIDQHQATRFSCSSTVPSADKPHVPPRVPIPPKPPKTTAEDKPPKIPPRVPLVPPCPPRTPSPKSLPIYINGVMPATQSFAANPKYVSKALQRQQSERAPPAAQFSPCIVPILKDGRQASATHYILLPPRQPAYTDRRERLMSEPARTGSSSIWQNR